MKEEVKDKTRLKHIIQALNEVELYIEGVDKLEFSNNSMMRFACIKQLEIIGEASITFSPQPAHTCARREITS
jgi:uncharacterized protein with HEPN domain